MEAFFVDPVTFTFTNPVTKTTKSLHVQVDHNLPFYDKIGIVTYLCLTKLGAEINGVHDELLMSYIAQNGFSNTSPRSEPRLEWIEPHLCKHLPIRQGNGVVWQK